VHATHHAPPTRTSAQRSTRSQNAMSAVAAVGLLGKLSSTARQRATCEAGARPAGQQASALCVCVRRAAAHAGRPTLPPACLPSSPVPACTPSRRRAAFKAAARAAGGHAGASIPIKGLRLTVPPDSEGCQGDHDASIHPTSWRGTASSSGMKVSGLVGMNTGCRPATCAAGAGGGGRAVGAQHPPRGPCTCLPRRVGPEELGPGPTAVTRSPDMLQPRPPARAWRPL